MLRNKCYSGGQEWDWMKDIEEDFKACGMKFEGWCEAAQKVVRCFQRVQGGTEVFRLKSHKDEKEESPG